MMTNNIQKHYASLTPVEKKIADWILSSPDQAIRSTAGQIAKNAGTAPSAVIRFCKSIGLEGFSELKIALAQEMGKRENASRLPAFQRGDTADHIVDKVFENAVSTLHDTCNMIDREKLIKMAAELEQAKRIFLFGVGTSSVIAVDAQYRLSQMGLWATAYTDLLFMNVTAAQAGPDDVVLAISHSGRTKAVVDAIRSAKKGGARVLSLTSFADSPLYLESDLAIAVYADEKNYPVEAVSARLGHLCLVDAMTMVLATKNFDNFARHIHSRNQILENIRYQGGNDREKSDSDIH